MTITGGPNDGATGDVIEWVTSDKARVLLDSGEEVTYIIPGRETAMTQQPRELGS